MGQLVLLIIHASFHILHVYNYVIVVFYDKSAVPIILKYCR